ncbi:hypothetical protein NW766_011909 [Fusarium irregulare]|uniref:Uncharacterized protein n=1 Tax=Fusarium irregulare TaxID=2494466 RepID=A0A9W8PF51_9HYPO|nr:hypothetical protein NW766_011909 [Fusarium irregulare]
MTMGQCPAPASEHWSGDVHDIQLATFASKDRFFGLWKIDGDLRDHTRTQKEHDMSPTNSVDRILAEFEVCRII